MKKINKVMITAITLFVIVGGILYAGPNLVVSPQRTSTAGQFWSDGDLFIDPRGFAAIDMNHMFGLVSFDSSQMAKIGFAKQFGPLYFGLYYGGNMLNIKPHIYNEQIAGEGFFSSGKNMRVYTTMPGYSMGEVLPENNISLLFGTADMGFRLSLMSTYWNRVLNEDFMAAGNYYKSFTDERGSISPEIAWGMARELVPGVGIKPHIYISMDFFRDYQRFERYATAADIQEAVTKSNNVTTLDITAAMGGLTLASKDAFEFGLDLWYSISLPFYDNEYMYMDGTEQKIASGFKGLYDSGVFVGLSEIRHIATPYLFASWSGERMMLSAELGLDFSFGSALESEMSPQANSGTLEKNGIENNETYFQFTPALSLGLQWAIVPEKLFLNAGGTLSLGVIDFKTTETREFENGSEKDNTLVKTIDDKFSAAQTRLSIGLTFNLTENVSFQGNCGIASNNVVNIFKSDSVGGSGLAVFSGILATVRF